MMKRITLLHLSLAGVCLLPSACDPGVEVPRQDLENKYALLYMPQAEGGPKRYALDIKGIPDEITFGTAYGGRSTVNEDIHVSLAVDPERVAAYNQEKGTTYVPLPAEAYTLDGVDVVIPRGKFSSTAIKAKIQTQALLPDKVYMLAVKIESTDSALPVNETLREALIIIDVNYPEFDRSHWTVVDLSSEEPKEATWGNGGQVIHTLDGKSSTFWHSKWDGGEAPPPHFFVIDMQDMHAVHGFSFLARQGNNDGKPKEVMVELSTDGSTWQHAETLTLANTTSLQEHFLTEGFNAEARYFRIKVLSSYFANYTHLAEIRAY